MMESSSLAVRVRFPVSFLGNHIGDEGASALAESLKQNTTLTELNLFGIFGNRSLQLYDGIKLTSCARSLPCFIFRESHWRRGSQRPSRVLEAEHHLDRAEPLLYLWEPFFAAV